MTKKQKQEANEAIERLRQLIKPGDRIYTILRKRSSSGMSRVIDCKVVGDDGSILHIGYDVALALGYKWDQTYEGMRVGGCGMDIGYHVVCSLSSALFKGKRHSDSGYALHHSWL